MGLQSDLLQRLASAHEEPSSDGGGSRVFRWVPIRSLSERHRPRIRAHLLALDEADRYLRFGYSASDNQVGTYVDRIDFARDEVFGVFNRRLELIALAHLAYFGESSGRPPSAEFGASVLPRARGRGYGSRLFDHATLHARNRGVDKLVIHALSENTAMLKIARNAGATVERSGPEAEAHLKLPPEDLASNIGELVETRAAELDYHLKVQAKRVDDLIDAIGEVKSRLGGKQVASE
jgi:ribosomal protein S18 acetylase RimI-like enzyme